jgi:serine/threonine protein kinase
MSPEQVLGSAEVDARCDLWAAGVVTYRMLCGRLPFAGETPHALVFAICRGEFKPMHHSGPHDAFQPWFERVFTTDKLKRYTTASEQCAAFQEAVRDALGQRDRMATEHTEVYDIERLMAQSAARAAEAASSEVPTMIRDLPMISELMSSSLEPAEADALSQAVTTFDDAAEAEVMPQRLGLTLPVLSEQPSLPLPPMPSSTVPASSVPVSSEAPASGVPVSSESPTSGVPVSESPEVIVRRLSGPHGEALPDSPPPSTAVGRIAIGFALLAGVALGLWGAAWLWQLFRQ